MLFNSPAFLFLFLPISLAAFWTARILPGARPAAAVLLSASLIFYAVSGFDFLLLLGVSIVANFLLGRALAARRSRLLLVLAIAANLAVLGYFKYANFAIDNWNVLTGQGLGALGVVLPIGISFYTFTQLTFLVDAFRGRAEERSFIAYALFVTYFPHLIAGPIMHHSEMMPQFKRRASRARLWQLAAPGFFLLIAGLGKKLLIADVMAGLSSPMFDGAANGIAPNFFSAWVGVLAYTMQIYFDFSGYCDMAIGLSLMFGVRLPLNFNSPYQARSIIDFWRRWHMTLSRLLRDYVYIPLGGARKGMVRRYLNLAATMLIGGFWHGANWTFVLWGALHGLYLILNHLWNGLTKGARLGWVGHALTLLAVIVAWVPFRAADWEATTLILSTMTGLHGLSAPLELHVVAQAMGLDLASLGVRAVSENERFQYYSALAVLGVGFVIALFAPNAVQMTRRYRPVANAADLPPGPLVFRPSFASGALLGLLALAVVMAMNAARPSEFLYFQF